MAASMRGGGAPSYRVSAVPRPALLLVTHGSRAPEGAEAARRFAARFAGRHPGLSVAAGFLELAPPPIADATAGLVAAGHDHVVAVPLMLLGAGHTKDDVPAALARERLRHPGVTFTYGRQLDLHPDVLAVLAERVDAVAGNAPRGDTAVVVVGRGSSDPDANSDLFKVARLLWEGRGYGWVEAAFSGITGPLLPAALTRCAALGARRVVVAPYYLFDGVLVRRIHEDAAAFAAAHPDVAVTVAGLLGDDDRLLDVVAERYAEAVGGDARMNCDLCVHRVALPGFEGEVGRAAVPHDHPEDSVVTGRHHDHSH